MVYTDASPSIYVLVQLTIMKKERICSISRGGAGSGTVPLIGGLKPKAWPAAGPGNRHGASSRWGCMAPAVGATLSALTSPISLSLSGA